ncbi:MAG: acetylglutamate kinase [Rhodospirillales bacterium]|nr:acetylglutamate kinase [Alphaproteobacteria bacterium]MCB9987249.1 acetylglutamate kinase [Rhodospirillales bacterium]USO07890.1 MAG: acetylglutamate kinase [Rhodospirillales bacterium]
MTQADLAPAQLSDINQIPDDLMARILDHVVNYKRQHEGLIHVVKASGKIVDNPAIRENFAKQVVAMRRDLGLKVVVVHGAGKQIDKALHDAGFVSTKENGLRVTQAEHMETIDRVARNTNRILCDMFGTVSRGDILPIGLSGYDSELDMFAQPISAATNNFSGEKVTSLNPWRLLRHLKDEKAIPIITNMCGAQDTTSNVTKINVNADSVASALAIHLKAHRLLMCSDVRGVLDENQHVIPEISSENFGSLKDRGILAGGMLVKVNEAFATAAQMPAGSGVVIMDENFLMELLTPKGHGTMIRAPGVRAPVAKPA